MEYRRQLLHIAVGCLALSLRYLGPSWALLFCVFGILFNVFSFPRLFPQLYRREETGLSGIALYPVAIFCLVALFGRHLWIVAGAWAILAFGDGFATLVGKAIGRMKLPYNPKKSYAGLIAFVVFGALGAWGMMSWTLADEALGAQLPLWAFALTAALVAGLLESTDLKFNDNLTVPLVAGITLYLCNLTHFGQFSERENLWHVQTTDAMYVIYALLNIVVATQAVIFGLVSRSGGLVGAIVGAVILTTSGWSGYALLVVFFVLASSATRFRYAEKAVRGIAQEAEGKRSAKHALANCGTAMVCSWLIGVGEVSEPVRLALCVSFVAAFATALADTLGSELGQVYGRTPFLPTTLHPVPVGTEGAISMEGTLIGLMGALVLAYLGWLFGVLPSLQAGVLVLVGAFVGTTAESYLGATLARDGWFGNEAMNFFNTLAGAVTAGSLFYYFYLI